MPSEYNTITRMAVKKFGELTINNRNKHIDAEKKIVKVRWMKSKRIVYRAMTIAISKKLAFKSFYNCSSSLRVHLKILL